MSAQTNDFFEKEKVREVARVKKQFDDFKHRVHVEQMGHEDTASHLLRADLHLNLARVKNDELTSELALKVSDLEAAKETLAKHDEEMKALK